MAVGITSFARKEEQGSGRSFRRKAETEASGLRDDARTRPQGCISAPFVPKGLFRVPVLNLGGQFLAGFLSRFRHGWSLFSAHGQKKRAAVFVVENSCSWWMYLVV